MWLVLLDAELAFSAWTFAGVAPFPAAREGIFALPSKVAMLEDSIASVKYRGTGVVVTALMNVFDRLASDGIDVVITPIHDDNIASRKAAEKLGFAPIANTRHTRRFGFKRITAERTGAGQRDDTLVGAAEELCRRIGASGDATTRRSS